MNPKIRNWPESCHGLMQCAGAAVWVFLLLAEQGSCCVGVESQQGDNVRLVMLLAKEGVVVCVS
jgi:hypothetical protein